MARGETLGQRRRRKRRERHGGDPAFDSDPPVTSPRRLAEAEERALEARPAWVKAIWATPGRRLVLSAGFIAGAVWIIASSVLDPGFLDRRRAGAGLLAAPLLLVLFGLTAYEALRDLRRGTNTRPTFYRIDDLVLATRAGRVGLVLYLVLGLGALVLLG